MKRALLIGVFLALAAGARADTLFYSNTTTDTLDTILYSVGPYAGIGDQIHLTSAGTAKVANAQLYNAGGPGSFDALLRFYLVGSPVGAQIGGTYALTGVTTTGGDVIDLTFNLGGLAVPQDLIFMISTANVASGLDLGVNMFEPPTFGSSDNAFMILDSGSFLQTPTTNENVYFQLRGEAQTSTVPEPSSLTLLMLVVVGISWAKIGRQSNPVA